LGIGRSVSNPGGFLFGRLERQIYLRDANRHARSVAPSGNGEINMAAASNYNAVLARLEYAIDSLHARGHQIDRGAAARALSYFSARASGAEYNEQAWRAAVEFMIEQGLCFEWIINGNVGSTIEMSASHFPGKTFDRFLG
jgi:hypothetical protein